MKEIILITGYNGFVGHSLVPLLTEKYDLIGIDNLSLSTKDRQLNKYLYKNYYINFASNKVRTIIKKYNIKTIIHLAACSTVSEGELNPDRYWKNNVDNTRKLFTIAGEEGVKNIIFFSSASVYGNQKGKLSEAMQAKPISTYAKTKLAVEKMSFEFNKRFGTNIICLRCFNIISDKLIHKNDTHLIPKIVDCLLNNKIFKLRKGKSQVGTDIRDYINVEEIGKYIEKILVLYKLKRLSGNLVLNMGTGKGTTILELVELAENIFDKKLSYEIIKKNVSDPISSICDTTKCCKLLGDSPKTDIELIIEKIKRDNN